MNVKIKKQIQTNRFKAILTYDLSKITTEDVEHSVNNLLNLSVFIEKRSYSEIAEELFKAEDIALIEIDFTTPIGNVIFTK